MVLIDSYARWQVLTRYRFSQSMGELLVLFSRFIYSMSGIYGVMLVSLCANSASGIIAINVEAS